MPIRMPLLVLFAVGMIAGAIRAYRLVKANRKTGQSANTLYAWVERPLNSWKYEPYAVTAILIHTLSSLVLGFLALRAASNQGLTNNPLFASDSTLVALSWLVQFGCIAIVSYHVGSLLIAFALTVFRRQPLAIAITDNGIRDGKNLVPWIWFSRYCIDSKEGILSLYSAFSPDLPSLTLKLPASISWVDLAGRLTDFLAIDPSQSSRAWYRTKHLLIPTMFLVCLSIAALGWLASRLSMELSLFMIALLTTLLVYLGGLVLNLFAFGILPGNAPSSKMPPTSGSITAK